MDLHSNSPDASGEYTGGGRRGPILTPKRSPSYLGSMYLRFMRPAVLLMVLSSCAVLNRKPAEPVNTVELPTVADDAADSLLVDISRVDSTIIVDLRYATKNNFTGAPLPGYEGNRAFLRAEAAAALAVANEDLRAQGYVLKIFDAYRPVRASEAMVGWTQSANRADLIKDGYIAARSRHNLGVAVDLTLVNLTTKAEVTMGTPFDHFSPAAFTLNSRGVILQNRQILKKVMERQGFTNYEKEWWHYSYVVENPVRFDKVVR